MSDSKNKGKPGGKGGKPRRIRQVQRKGPDLQALRSTRTAGPELSDRYFHTFCIASGDGNVHTFAHQRLRNALANAAVAAEYQRAFSCDA